ILNVKEPLICRHSGLRRDDGIIIKSFLNVLLRDQSPLMHQDQAYQYRSGRIVGPCHRIHMPMHAIMPALKTNVSF
ncbi:MAG: hypothetical protein OEM43_09290, partial [Gammaproteobacteria bacterium]|nr:hypothetical protein [Gammaproteobacteria bacterium]